MKKNKLIVILLFLFCISQAFTVTCGDVNSDATVDIIDALLIAQDYVGQGILSETVADVNGDGSVDIIDALLVAQYYVGIVEQLSACPQEPTPAPTAPVIQEGMIGYAAMNGGTTGGVTGPTVTVTNSSEFNEYAGSHDAYVIQISGTINLGGQEYVREDKSIIGLGSDATIVGGIKISGYDNYIIRNITFRNSSGDGITLQNSRNVWIDHCTFIDASDGNLDIVHGSDWITVSWCKFYYTTDHGHNYSNLIGHSDSNGDEDDDTLHITFHHNWWGTLVIERMPSIRFGTVHLFNNYFNAPGNNYCIRTRINSEILVENNFFEDVKNPWERYVTRAGGDPGKLLASGNEEVNTTWYVNPEPDDDGNQSFLIPGNDSVFSPPYPYELEDPESARSAIISNAGPQG